ncbi:hypothetical protein BC939DRAFT_104866 [Gamsiella multidivaricata]|uniref:uncharacterized protein n=1 Tax=Gamsiella multidivaricata TaxID=101098 RepID=UPI002220EB51|nr:uncharacterized protein BC939DRAFT_104866 [Gamsiella multidivaricata]KAI7832482.1 hypothetical protein BC939DRAFT_104866 [Gamsiella multidivaricata]
MIGNQFLNFTQQDNKMKGQVNWSVQSGYKTIDAVIEDVGNGNYWGAMVVQPNASVSLNKALSGPNSDYDPTKAFMFIYDGGRDPLSVKPYILASMYTQFLQFTKTFNPIWVYFVLTYADEKNTTLTPLASAPQVLGIPVAFEELDIHPLSSSIIASATSVAYIWIFLVAGGSTYLVAYTVQPLTREGGVTRTMMLLLIPLLVFLCSLSMVYSITLRIFGVLFESAGQFLSLFMGMLLLQAAVASLILFLIFLIPVRYIPVITVTFVVMNMIAIFHPVELMPPFYRWVYAMPFLNAVQMARFVLTGSYNRLVYNLPILFAWILVPLTLLPFAIARQKRLMMEILELEEQDRRQSQQRYYSDKDTGLRYYTGEDDDDDDDVYDYRSEKAGRYSRKSRESERRRARSSTRHRGLEQKKNSSEDGLEGEDVSESRNERRQRRRRRNHRSGSNGDSDDRGDDSEENSQGLSQEGSVAKAARLIRPLNPRTLSSGAVPSAPPESQMFSTHHGTVGRTPSGEQNRSLFEMPKLSRHPYAAELVRPQTPAEVK